ncbi:MAG: Mor transcription activator family protein [Desulfovibrionaceae bacterium]
MTDTTRNRTLAAELLLDLAGKLEGLAILRFSASPEDAKAFGEAAAGMIADDWGGQSIYVPMDIGGLLASRNERIWKEFTGDNVSSLAQKYGTSVQNIYRVIKAARAKHAQRQHSLFD